MLRLALAISVLVLLGSCMPADCYFVDGSTPAHCK
jgi:hypothetical protein